MIETIDFGKNKAAIVSSGLALSFALLLTFILILIFSPSPLAAAGAFFIAPFSSAYGVGSLLARAVPLAVVALGSAFAFRSGAVNLGGEGQIYLGAVAGFMALNAARGLPAPLAIGLGTLAAFIAAAAIGLLSPLARRLSGALELISSFLVSAAIVPILDWLVAGPLRDPGTALVATAAIPESFRLPKLLAVSSLNASAFLFLILLAASEIFISRSSGGLELRLSGEAPKFAGALGLRRRLWRAVGFALGAGIIGLAGFWLMQGRDFRVIRSFSSGLGWSGLACAIVARSNPLFIPFASLLFAWVERGAEGAEIAAGLPHELSGVIEACVFLAVASDILLNRTRARKKP